jgi:Domain of Unknown Function (DUF1080)
MAQAVNRQLKRGSLLLVCAVAFAGCIDAQGVAWKPLFDGKTLKSWREAPFKGHAAVQVEKGTLVLNAGSPMTGATFTGAFPKSNYEVRFEAVRLQGNDFFASLTFPVGESFCTWVTGGWGGDIVGLSSIDGWDAADNETRAYFNFENGRWYQLRLMVAGDRIQAFIDDKQIISVDIGGRTVGLRFEDMKLSAPLGFASYLTKGAVRNVEYRTVTP